MGLEVLLLASFGDVKSNRSLLGPLHTFSNQYQSLELRNIGDIRGKIN